ncbi:hypothetical protein GBA52_013927 [Prunus armeniaca]|nr:hypothetical protein GBA52_013927 [Prunus armeniaca]
MDSIDPSKGMSTLDATMEDSQVPDPKALWKKMGPVEKEASVHEEMKRMQKLPANNLYKDYCCSNFTKSGFHESSKCWYNALMRILD